jgi:phosphoglycerate dehydrogenase-like enzyme
MARVRVVYTDPAWALDECGAFDPDLATIEREIFQNDIDLEFGAFREGFALAGEDLYERVRGADAIVVHRAQVTPTLVEAAGPACRVYARQGVGLDNLNAELLRERGIWSFHVPDYCGDEVSSHALGLCLALERGIPAQDALVKSDRWSIKGGGIPRRTCKLDVGIVGFGKIGRASAHKLAAVYGRVFAFDPFVNSDVMASHGVLDQPRLEDLLAGCDAIVLHAALTPESEGMIDRAALATLKPGAILVNVARGKLVNAAALLEALEDGRLGGFASDVFSPEDPNATPEGRALLRHQRVVFTAHRAFLSTEAEVSQRRRIAEGVAHVLRRHQPPIDGRVS